MIEKYRTEIDGLRAFAVLPVILHHAFPTLLPGGFVGVDIFYVISGYLITNILIEDIRENNFSLLTFYERRFRRILPALIVVLAISTAAAFILIPNDELKEYLQSLTGAALFYSNVVFWLQSDYFAVEAALKPLLHTWSLAIEEQFYIFFPIVLLISFKYIGEKLWMPILALALTSLYLSHYYSSIYPTASFYLLHTRFWELALGAMVALGFGSVSLRGPGWLGWLGVAMILLAIFLTNEDMPFPGLIALVPTLGAAFVLVGARDANTCANFLSFRPFVWMGLISYSAYLWHQPILVFGRKLFLHEVPIVAKLTLIAISIIIAFFSWRFIEKPFRNRSFFSRNQILTASIAVLAAVAFLSQTALSTGIGTDRTTLAGHSTKWLENLKTPNRGLARVCDAQFQNIDEKCINGDQPEYILWGDSYAMHLAQAMAAGDMKFIQITMSSCAPIMDVATFSKKYGLDWGDRCFEHNDRSLKLIIESDIQKIILSSHFGALTSNNQKWNVRGKIFSYDEAKTFQRFLDTLAILQSHGKSVVIVSPMPQPPFAAADCMINASFLGRPFSDCNFPRDLDRRGPLYDALDSISQQSGVEIVFLRDFVCDAKTCAVEINGVPMYRDSLHMPPFGSTALGENTAFVEGLKNSFPRSSLP